jgi:hypothetical protein
MVLRSDRWPNDYFYTNEVYPLKRYAFGQLQVWGPQHPIPHLNRAYGPEWNAVAYRQTNHAVDPKHYQRVILTPKHRVPAEPQGPLVDRVKLLVRDANH